MQQVDEKTPSATQVKAEVSQADQKNKDLIDKLNARKANLEEDVKHARVFQGSLAEIEAWLPEATERVSAQQPISTDPEMVKKQLEEAQVCFKHCPCILWLVITRDHLAEKLKTNAGKKNKALKNKQYHRS